MRSRSLCKRRILRARRSLSRAIGWAVACAIALQVGAGGPLVMRMAAQAAAESGPAIAHCMPAESGHAASHHGGHDGPSSPGHAHQTCLLCQGALGPLLVLAVVPPLPSSAMELPAGASWADRLPAQQAVGANAPRAPPMNA